MVKSLAWIGLLAVAASAFHIGHLVTALLFVAFAWLALMLALDDDLEECEP